MTASIDSGHWPIPFWKMSGAGNDFVIIDHRRPLIKAEQMAEFARLVCRRKFGVGADGLFFIENSEQAYRLNMWEQELVAKLIDTAHVDLNVSWGE